MLIIMNQLILQNQRISKREAQILKYCALGLTISQTANILFISPKTVDNHHSNLRIRYKLRGFYALHDFSLKVQYEVDKLLETV